MENSKRITRIRFDRHSTVAEPSDITDIHHGDVEPQSNRVSIVTGSSQNGVVAGSKHDPLENSTTDLNSTVLTQAIHRLYKVTGSSNNDGLLATVSV